jgi:hypothetical protein
MRTNHDIIMTELICPQCQWKFLSGDPKMIYCSSDCEIKAIKDQECPQQLENQD